MTAFFSWLAGTRAGRWTAVIVAAVAAFFIAAVKIFSAGQSAEKAKQDGATLDAYRSRNVIDDDNSKKSDADLRRDLGAWSMRKSDNS